MTKADVDFNRPESAAGVGTELAVTMMSLADRLSLTNAVVDMPSLEQAVADRRTIGDASKKVETFFEPFIRLAHQLHKSLCDRRNEILLPLQTLDKVKRDAIRAYNELEDRRRQEQERALAEQRRREDDARAIAEAAAYETAGESAMADAVMHEQLAAPPPVVVLPNAVREVAKFRRSWRWRVKYAEMVPREFLCLDTRKLDKYATAMQASAKVPGVEFYYVDDPVR